MKKIVILIILFFKINSYGQVNSYNGLVFLEQIEYIKKETTFIANNIKNFGTELEQVNLCFDKLSTLNSEQVSICIQNMGSSIAHVDILIKKVTDVSIHVTSLYGYAESSTLVENTKSLNSLLLNFGNIKITLDSQLLVFKRYFQQKYLQNINLIIRNHSITFKDKIFCQLTPLKIEKQIIKLELKNELKIISNSETLNKIKNLTYYKNQLIYFCEVDTK